MNPQALLARVDPVMDPLGLLFVVVAYFANKYWGLELTADDVLIASAGFGALRTAYERWKRGKSIGQATPEI